MFGFGTVREANCIIKGFSQWSSNVTLACIAIRQWNFSDTETDSWLIGGTREEDTWMDFQKSTKKVSLS